MMMMERGPLHGFDERGDVGFGHDLAVEPLLLGRHHEVVDLARRAIVDRDGVALLGDVQRQVGAHYGKANEADIGRRHRCSSEDASVFVARFFGMRRLALPAQKPSLCKA